MTALSTAAFFGAITAADQWVAERDALARAAVFAPLVSSSASCCCGSTIEIRATRIDATSGERQAAAQAVADLLGRSVLDVDLEIVTAVVEAINRERDIDDHQAIEDFLVDHEHCGELS